MIPIENFKDKKPEINAEEKLKAVAALMPQGWEFEFRVGDSRNYQCGLLTNKQYPEVTIKLYPEDIKHKLFADIFGFDRSYDVKGSIALTRKDKAIADKITEVVGLKTWFNSWYEANAKEKAENDAKIKENHKSLTERLDRLYKAVNPNNGFHDGLTGFSEQKGFRFWHPVDIIGKVWAKGEKCVDLEFRSLPLELAEKLLKVVAEHKEEQKEKEIENASR
ncbi:MAG TPA: hypothetical protein PLP33_29245 [Leptospiraceae bacterium]|nr:hypothetical protein [Leptospiraceae bacterium]